MASPRSSRGRRARRGTGVLAALYGIIALLALYLAASLAPVGASAWEWAVALLGVALISLAPGTVAVGVMRGALDRRLIVPAAAVLGFFTMVLGFAAARDITWALSGALGALPSDNAWFRNATSMAVLGVSATTWVWSLWRANAGPRVVDVKVPVPDLHPALHGFTIAQISDVHIGETLRRPFMQSVVDAINELQVDLVAITGDLVDGSVDALSQHTEPLGEIRSRHGTFSVLGNHDYYSGALSWMQELERYGVQVLVNTHKVLTHNGAPFVVGGVTDHSMGASIAGHESDPHRAASGAPSDAFRLLLAHQPVSAHEGAKAGFHLQLSGHTHAGQAFPGTFFARFLFPFVEGLHKEGEMSVYVNSGTGWVGAPIRTNRHASEITRLTLVRLAEPT